MAKILVLHGPNLNLLGSREPELYGSDTLADINARLQSKAHAENACLLEHFQSNAEHDLVDKIHDAKQNKIDFIIINAAALTHTSVALRDALAGVEIPFIEVHLSNVYAREEFRQHSFLADLAQGVICGLGAQGYEFALQAALHHINTTQK